MSTLYRNPMASIVLIIAMFLFFTFSGCATSPSASAVRVKDADMRMVSNCQFVGDVHGTSGWGNLAASTGIQNAKNEARENAAAMGSTHIIWTDTAGGYSPYVNGKAYKCK